MKKAKLLFSSIVTVVGLISMIFGAMGSTYTAKPEQLMFVSLMVVLSNISLFSLLKTN